MPGNSSTHAGENFRLRGKKLQFARAETSAVDGDSTTDDDNYTNDDGIRTNDGEARRNYAAKQKNKHNCQRKYYAQNLQERHKKRSTAVLQPC